MRAEGPEDALGPTLPVPRPKFQIGDKVRLVSNHNTAYWRKCYLRHLLRHWRLRKRGRLSEHVKNLIREAYRALATATTAEVVGIVPRSHHSIDYPRMNQCYIGGVPGASSPLYYEYQLLVRWLVGKNTLAMVTGIPVAGDFELEKIEA